MLQPHERNRLNEIGFRVECDLDAKSIDVRWLLALVESLVAENDRLSGLVEQMYDTSF